MVDSDWRREIRWPGAPDRGPAPRTGASLFVNRRARTAEAGPRDPGVPTKSRWWGADFVGWDGVHGRRRSVGNSESIIYGWSARAAAPAPRGADRGGRATALPCRGRLDGVGTSGRPQPSFWRSSV